MHLSTPLQYDGNPRATADSVAELEKAGLDMVWVAEAYGYDSPTLMGYLAAKTERLQIAAGILNVFSRTPGAILQTAAGLDNVSGGRRCSVLGASGPQVIEGFHGLPYDKPLGRTREVIRIVRSGLKREPLQPPGSSHPAAGRPGPRPRQAAEDPGPPRARHHPDLGGLARRQERRDDRRARRRLAADPVHPRAGPRGVGASLDAGTAKRDPELGPLQVSAGGMVAIGEDVKGLLDFLRPMYALYVGGMGARGKNFYNELAQHYGYEKEAKEIQDLYLDGKKKEAERLVPMEWMEQSNLVGPASYVQERIAAFKEAGVSHLSIVPATENPAATISQLKDWVS